MPTVLAGAGVGERFARDGAEPKPFALRKRLSQSHEILKDNMITSIGNLTMRVAGLIFFISVMGAVDLHVGEIIDYKISSKFKFSGDIIPFKVVNLSREATYDVSEIGRGIPYNEMLNPPVEEFQCYQNCIRRLYVDGKKEYEYPVSIDESPHVFIEVLHQRDVIVNDAAVIIISYKLFKNKILVRSIKNVIEKGAVRIDGVNLIVVPSNEFVIDNNTVIPVSSSWTVASSEAGIRYVHLYVSQSIANINKQAGVRMDGDVRDIVLPLRVYTSLGISKDVYDWVKICFAILAAIISYPVFVDIFRGKAVGGDVDK